MYNFTIASNGFAVKTHVEFDYVTLEAYWERSWNEIFGISFRWNSNWFCQTIPRQLRPTQANSDQLRPTQANSGQLRLPPPMMDSRQWEEYNSLLSRRVTLFILTILTSLDFYDITIITYWTLKTHNCVQILQSIQESSHRQFLLETWYKVSEGAEGLTEVASFLR